MSPPPSAVRVLIVDDHVDCAESLAQLLHLGGYEVRVAHEGLQAIELAESWRPGVVLLDIGLPDLDGHEVARRIRASDGGSRTLLIGVSGWDEDEHPSNPRSSPLDHRMVKPIDLDALERLMPAADPSKEVVRAA